MSRSWPFFVEDIENSCRHIIAFTSGMTQAEFIADEKTYWATIKMIEIVGEAARNLPAEIKTQLPNIEWSNIIATRNVFAHAYFGIDDDILWDLIKVDIPELLEHIEGFQLTLSDQDVNT